MRLAILQDRLRCGGTEKQSLFLARTLQERGQPVRLVVFRPDGVLAGHARGIEHDVLQPWDFGVSWIAPGLTRRLRAFAPDAILCMGFHANYFAGWLQGRFPDAEVVATVRTGVSLPWIYRRSLRRARTVQVNCEWWKHRLVSAGFAADRVRVVHNPLLLDLESRDRERERAALRAEHGVTEDTCVCLCLQAFREGKNHDRLIEHFTRLADVPGWELWLAGDGAERRRCEALAAGTAIAPRVRFLGFQEDPTACYLAADVAVTASTRDSLPNFLVEAQAAGLPAVAVDAMGIGEAFSPGETGYLLAPDDAGGFVAAVAGLVADAALRERMAAAARRLAHERFAPARQVERTLAAFDSWDG